MCCQKLSNKIEKIFWHTQIQKISLLAHLILKDQLNKSERWSEGAEYWARILMSKCLICKIIKFCIWDPFDTIIIHIE